MRVHPLYVLAFLALLGVPQALAFVQQFRGGYRPLKAAPHRVPFSWDMFAVRIERCDVVWNPPLPEGRLFRLHQKASLLEWDFTFDHEEDYRQLVAWTCGTHRTPFHATLLCLKPEGRLESHAIDCR